MKDMLPPQDYHAECVVLKELITNPDSIVVPMTILTEDMFYSEKNREIFKAIKDLYDNHEIADLVTIYPKIDGTYFNSYILPNEAHYSPEVIESHCAHLRLTYLKRKAHFYAIEMMEKCADAFVSEEEILSLPTNLNDVFSKSSVRKQTQSIGDVFNMMDKQLHEGVKKRVSSGFPRVDMATYGGFAAGQLIVLAARPSVGKTAVMLSMARAALAQGVPALAVSLEMTNEEIAQRLIFSTGYVSAVDMARGQFDWTKFDLAYTRHARDPLYMDDTVHTIGEVCSTITLNHIQGKCDIAFIDYLQLMSDTGANTSLYQQVSGITKKLKQLAKTLGIPIVLLAQLNRNSVSFNRSPMLHDLRDSGSIEQDADIVLMLEREYEKGPDGKDVPANTLLLWIRKNRGGAGTDTAIRLDISNGYTIFTESQNQTFNG